MELKELESAIEAILFAAGDPVPAERICTALEQDRETVDAVCQRLADDYSYERGGSGSFGWRTAGRCAPRRSTLRPFVKR